MSKYSSELKLEVVNYYLSNYISYDNVAKLNVEVISFNSSRHLQKMFNFFGSVQTSFFFIQKT